jgi:predicted XRE-type DNA-binding protein
MDISNLNLSELRDLSAAISAEARRRARQYEAIAQSPASAKNGRSEKPHANTGRKVGQAIYSVQQFVDAANAGMTQSEAARHIGCKHSWVSVMARKHGIKFKPDPLNRGRKRD